MEAGTLPKNQQQGEEISVMALKIFESLESVGSRDLKRQYGRVPKNVIILEPFDRFQKFTRLIMMRS